MTHEQSTQSPSRNPGTLQRFREGIRKIVRRHYRQHRAAYWVSYARNRRALTQLCRRIKTADTAREIVAISLIEHIGDIVACEPIARHIRREKPGAFIIWCLRKPFRELVDHNPNIDHVLTVGCLSEWMHLSRQGFFDTIYDLHFTGRTCRHCSEHLIKGLDKPQVTLGNYFDWGCLLEAYCTGEGLPPLTEGPRLYIPKHVRSKVDTLRLPEKFALLHCVTNEDSKNWKSDKWPELASRITQAHGLEVIEVGLEQQILGVQSSYRNLCGRLSLLETGEVIRRASLFIGLDSGPAHLANAVGTPGIILLGHYRNFSRPKPYSGAYGDASNAELLYAEGPAAEISVERVLGAVEARLARVMQATAAHERIDSHAAT